MARLVDKPKPSLRGKRRATKRPAFRAKPAVQDAPASETVSDDEATEVPALASRLNPQVPLTGPCFLSIQRTRPVFPVRVVS